MAARATKRSASKKKAASSKQNEADGPTWTFLSNHSHVLISLHQDPDMTIREVAQRVGITERSVQRIVGELIEGGYLIRERDGLRNHYRFRDSVHLRHPIEAHCQIGDLIRMVGARVD